MPLLNVFLFITTVSHHVDIKHISTRGTNSIMFSLELKTNVVSGWMINIGSIIINFLVGILV